MVHSARRWMTASMSLLLAAAGLTAWSATAAGSPTVGVGGSAPSNAAFSGQVGPGNPDPLGPPAPACQPNGGCQRTDVVLKAPAGWTKTHTISLGVSLSYGSGGSNDLDVGIFDSHDTLLASDFAVSNGQIVVASGVTPSTYTIEVDGDATTGLQSYTAHVTATSAKKYVPPKRTGGGLTFSRPTLVDPYRVGTEPTIAVAPDASTIYESPIFGFSTTQSFLMRSTNGGKTFNVLGAPGVGKLDQCTGGGDSDVATDQFTGDLYNIDLGGAPEVPARVSNNRGLSFASSCEANFHDGANYFTDRQWLATDLKHHVEWYIYRDGVLSTDTLPGIGGTEIGKQGYGEFLKFAPLAKKAGTAGANQLAFNSICKNSATAAAPCILDVQIAGNALTDNSKSSPHYGTTFLALERPLGVGIATFNTSGAKSVHEYYVAKGRHQVLFPTVAVDRAGVTYLTWTDANDYRVYLSHSVGTNLNKWTKPVVVEGGHVMTTVMPWIVAGSKGRIDIVFLGTANPKNPTLNYGPWYPYLAQSLNATKAAPTFHQARMTDRPTHIDPVCLSGLGCTTNTGPAGDRELGDFFRVVIDKFGRALVSFADGDNQLGQEVANGPLAAPSFGDFVRQSTGPSLIASVGKLRKVSTPANCVVVSNHHNPVPYDLPAVGKQGSDVAALNLRSSCLTMLSNGNLRATLSLKKVDAQAAISPPALANATYMVRWVYKNKVFFAAAEDNAQKWRFFSGQSAPVTDGLAIKYAYYPASGTATGKVEGGQRNQITITVPRNQVGAPPAGARLSQVTGYAITHASPTASTPPTASNFTDLPQVADVLPAYAVKLTKPHSASASVVVAPLHPRTSWWAPSTWTSSASDRQAAALLLVLASVGCALVGRRRSVRLAGRAGHAPKRRWRWA